MTIEQISAAIQTRARDRFELQVSGEEIDILLSLAPEPLNHCSLIRLRRAGYENAGWRTILIAALESVEHISNANRWASEVRDTLPEPGTADLYLILFTNGITGNIGARIEADELFCRKFVMRQNESVEELLDRTFLTQTSLLTEALSFTDPLQAAFSQTAERHPWLLAQQQEAWRSALLSSKPGSDIVDDLLVHVPGGEVTQ